MLKKLLFLLFALVALCSCEKPYVGEADDISEPNGNLRISVYQLEQTPFSVVSRTPASEVCTRLNFAVYQTDGSKLKQINQQLGDAAFGTASFLLEEGTYRLVIVAHSSNGNPTMTDIEKIQFTNAQGYSDTFLYSEVITISSEPKSLSPTLNRITALCRFSITDDFPAEVKKMRFYYTGGSGAFDATTGYGNVASKQDVKFDVVSGKKSFDLYSYPYKNTEGTLHLTVTALDAAENTFVERTFDVAITRNKISNFSGTFFNGGGSQSTDVSVDVNATWAGENNMTY